MFQLFKRNRNRIKIDGDKIYLDNSEKNIEKAVEIEAIFSLIQAIPELKVYENNELVKLYRIETLDSNPNLAGQFLHTSIRVLGNSAVMIDGIVSKSEKVPTWKDKDYEGIRFQPFFLSNANDKNIQLIGKGLFDRGLHFAGTVTPATVRCVCICDYCKQSFSIQSFHAGFSEVQYFYSDNSRQTLVVPASTIPNMPTQLQEKVDNYTLPEIENKLPKCDDGHFRYYNSFRCPHCLASFIDFEKNQAMRPKEYYGNTLLNQKTIRWSG
jgi:hypothetical protein